MHTIHVNISRHMPTQKHKRRIIGHPLPLRYLQGLKSTAINRAAAIFSWVRASGAKDGPMVKTYRKPL